MRLYVTLIELRLLLLLLLLSDGRTHPHVIVNFIYSNMGFHFQQR